MQKSLLTLLIPKKSQPASLEIYIYLEKLLLAEQKAQKQKNTGYFTSNDINVLMTFFKISEKKLFKAYCDDYILGENTDGTDIHPNFRKMLNSERNPNKILITTITRLIFHNELSPDAKGRYYCSNALFNSTNITFSTYCEIENYISLCKIISKLKGENLQPYDIKSYSQLLETKISDSTDVIRDILLSNSLLSKYIFIADNPYNEPSNDADDYDNDFFDISPCVASLTLDDYRSTCQELNSPSTLHKYFDSTHSGLLVFFLRNIELLKKLDKNFWQLLFLLQFLTCNELESLTNNVPSHTFTIKKVHSHSYYKSVKQILEIPELEETLLLSTDKRQQLIQNVSIYLQENASFPKWILFTIHNLSQQQLLTAKYLYLTYVLGYRFKHEEPQTNLPPELLTLFKKLGHADIKQCIQELDKLPFNL